MSRAGQSLPINYAQKWVSTNLSLTRVFPLLLALGYVIINCCNFVVVVTFSLMKIPLGTFIKNLCDARHHDHHTE